MALRGCLAAINDVCGPRPTAVRAGAQGVGKGLVGAVAAPVSGGLDLFSSAVEGLDASKAALFGNPRAGVLLGRRRLPRVIGGDFRLKPFTRHGSERAVGPPPPTPPKNLPLPRGVGVTLCAIAATSVVNWRNPHDCVGWMTNLRL